MGLPQLPETHLGGGVGSSGLGTDGGLQNNGVCGNTPLSRVIVMQPYATSGPQSLGGMQPHRGDPYTRTKPQGSHTFPIQTPHPFQPPPVPLWSVPAVIGRIPQIPSFTGERAAGESFSDWHEHFENVAKLAGWDDHWKLVHLTSNL